MKITFLHPDLGIGGAERLVVDAAVALCGKGHRVTVMTGHHDRQHCFDETKDGTFYVMVLGKWIPRQICGRFHALLAYLKMIFIAFYVCFFARVKPDVIICDQVSACLVVLKYFTSSKTIFYCHFPDKLLTKRESTGKRVYRYFLDWFEEKTTGMADVLLVNSNFTAATFRRSFPSLRDRKLHCVYPSLNVAKFDLEERRLSKMSVRSLTPTDPTRIFLSINRYERKKNLVLAIEAFAALESKVTADEFNNFSLVMVGGYDRRVLENVEYHEELEQLAEKHGLKNRVRFLRSITSGKKVELLRAASVVLYTPSNEHFGIVPIEAMYTKNPVIAVNNGGPCETVVDGETGYLCKPDKDSFAEAMLKLRDYETIKRMGEAGHDRVMKHFSFDAFTQSLNDIVTATATGRPAAAAAAGGGGDVKKDK